MAEATITARSRAAAAGGSARGSSATSGNAGESTLKGRGAAPGSTTKVSGNGHKGLRAGKWAAVDDERVLFAANWSGEGRRAVE